MSKPEFSSLMVSASLTLLSSDQVTLHVGEKRFITTRGTLTEESGFFAALLSSREDNAKPDGSYLIDANAELFGHILRYLRRGVLPIFYDNSKGHDYALYTELLAEAKYFQIDRLEKWLKEKSYLQAIRIAHWPAEIDDAISITKTLDTNYEMQYHPVWTTRKVYVCPRRLAMHRGNPRACGRQCQKAQGDADDEYEDEEFWKTLTIRKQTIFDQQMCLGGR